MNLFVKNNPLIMGGATAFFTMFALPPIIIILVQVFSLFINPQTIRHELSVGLTDVFGREVVRQLVSVIRAVRKLSYNWIAAILVFIFLIFVSHNCFKIIRNTINQIWEIKEPEFKIMNTLRGRLKTLLVILVTGIIFIIGVFVETIQVMIGNYFVTIVPSISTILNQVLGL
jgi:membrane protein